MQIRTTQLLANIFSCMMIVYLFSSTLYAQKNSPSIRQLNLDQCIQIAVENNRMYNISKHQLQIAEAQYKQALSTYWPQLTANVEWTQQDEAPFMLYPPSQMAIPPIPIMGTALELNLPLRDSAQNSVALRAL